MARVLLYLWENFGLDALQLGLCGWFFWKILTNHFKHLQDDVSSIKDSQKETNKKVDRLSERVSNIEGQLK